MGGDADKKLPSETEDCSFEDLGLIPYISDWFKSRYGKPNDLQARAWPYLAQNQHSLLSAPTGSGKTLAAFMLALNKLFEKGLVEDNGLTSATRILYIAPMKALTCDIQSNVDESISGINAHLYQTLGKKVVIRTHLRNGDTPAYERARCIKHRPHLIMTTPESFYLLLTSKSGREILKSVETLIIDEVHAFLGNKRGAHLALSMERLCMLKGSEYQRIGLSATIANPDQAVQFLIGNRKDCIHINIQFPRLLDVRCEVPFEKLGAFLTHDQLLAMVNRLKELILDHQCTLIFVRSRREAERMFKLLLDQIPNQSISVMHSSLSTKERKRVLKMLKKGTLRAVVSTSSLELGVDIGAIDLICQIGSTGSILDFKQRLGRCGRTPDALSKCRLFPKTREDLLECYTLIQAVSSQRIDEKPCIRYAFDVLAQQITAEVSCDDYKAETLYARFKQVAPYTNLDWSTFLEQVRVLACGYPLGPGRQMRLIHHDQVNGVLRSRRNTRMHAILNAGTIPDQFDYSVVLMPERIRVGSLNEDFAIESIIGSIFQLGNHTYRILSVQIGEVLGEDAQNQAPNIPFWLGEGPARSNILSQMVSDNRIEGKWRNAAIPDLKEQDDPSDICKQLDQYRSDIISSLGVIPSNDTIVLERFFDDSQDQHLVIHSCLGARINRAWGLALRKCFCRRFNFELQAAALDNAIMISLGAIHSFELKEVASWLTSRSVVRILTQAVLDSQVFNLRWRWAATNALAVPRRQYGKRLPPYLSRIYSENLLSALFPDQLKCLENIQGDREVPDHPLVLQVLSDCLDEFMDLEGLMDVLKAIEKGAKRVVCIDTLQPSVIACEILHASPYAFLDDAPLEERRSIAAQSRSRSPAIHQTCDQALEPLSIAAIFEQLALDPRNKEELHDALLMRKCIVKDLLSDVDHALVWLQQLQEEKRIYEIKRAGKILCVSAEYRLLLHKAMVGQMPSITQSESSWIMDDTVVSMSQQEALAEVLIGYMSYTCPLSSESLAALFDLPCDTVEYALALLKNQGSVLSGYYGCDIACSESEKSSASIQWCERSVLYRISNHTRNARRQSRRLVKSHQFMHFLAQWHGLMQPGYGRASLDSRLRQMEGYNVSFDQLEMPVLHQRINDYSHAMLDELLLSGRFRWISRAFSIKTGIKEGTMSRLPVTIIPRSALSFWQRPVNLEHLSAAAKGLYDILCSCRSAFLDELMQESGMLMPSLKRALRQLVANGLVTCDSYQGARWLSGRMRAGKISRHQNAHGSTLVGMGRWALSFPRAAVPNEDDTVRYFAQTLLRRYGVVSREWMSRESLKEGIGWAMLLRTLRKMEARDEIAGGRFIEGLSGEQFAHPEALPLLNRAVQEQDDDQILLVSAADPVNLTGILTTERIASRSGNYLLLRSGHCTAALEQGNFRSIKRDFKDDQEKMRMMIARKCFLFQCEQANQKDQQASQDAQAHSRADRPQWASSFRLH